MRSRAKGVFALASLSVALGCAKPSPPTLVPVSATVTQLSPEGIGLSVALDATNSNGVDLSAQTVSAHVVLNRDIDLGTVTSSQPITLSAGKTTPVTVPLSVKWASVASFASLAKTTGDVPFAIDGTFTMGGALVNVSLPFHIEGNVTHAQLVNMALRSIPGIETLPGLPH